MAFPSDDLDWLGAIFWVLFFFVPISQQFVSNSNIDTRAIYRRFSRKIPGSPPSWVFGILWPVWFILLGIGTWLGWRSTAFRTGNKNEYDLFILFAVLHGLFLKLWTPVFTGALDFALGLVVIFLAIATNATALAFAARAELWVTVGFFGAVLLWLLYAFYLNAMSLKYQKCVKNAVAAMRCCRAQMYKDCLDRAMKM